MNKKEENLNNEIESEAEKVENENQTNQEVSEQDSKDEQEEVVELTLEEQLEKEKNNTILALAELENMRKRNANEIQDIKKYGVAPLARDLFTVYENLNMALKSISEEDKQNNTVLNNLYFGLDMVLNNFKAAFNNNKIDIILPNVGDTFDHNLHQAMSEIESDDVEPGKIAQVIQPAYKLEDRLLKPSVVNVAKNVSNETDVQKKDDE